MTTKTAEKTALEIKRFINPPRDRVYAAWTDPVQLKEWWGPKDVQTLKIVADTRVGGKYRWDLVNQEGDRQHRVNRRDQHAGEHRHHHAQPEVVRGERSSEAGERARQHDPLQGDVHNT